MDAALTLLAGTLLIAVIIAANGYFVAQEFAYMAVDRSRLKALAGQGDRAARRTLRITDRTSFMLSGAQLGITITGLLVGYVAEPVLGSAIGELLGGVGVPTMTGVLVGTVLVLVLSTVVQMLFGELFPKNLAIARPYPVAQRLSRSTLLYIGAFGWLIRVFDASSNALLKVLRIEPVHDVGHSANLHDLRRIVSVSRDAGELPPELSLVLDRMLDFPRRPVSHALVPRSRVDVLAHDTPLAQVREAMEGGHSRYPVLDEEGDVAGVVHLVDVLEALHHGTRHEAPVSEVARPATVLPTTMLLPDALGAMDESGDQMACVVDEYGGFVGVVTLEDLAEEVVGEITDEHDAEEERHMVLSQTQDRWTVRGDAPLDEVERELGVALPEGDYVTVGGLVIATHGALPREGEQLVVPLPDDPAELAHDDHPPRRHLEVEVLEVARHVPTQLAVALRVAEHPDHVGDPEKEQAR
ncbi:Hemolysin C [Nocardioides dokdonensis FR1436]|uniref:Hemolysin C n=1 Tax=Nocardioides dokdonensis FR1436 TaxID=1300347 RepID=A0A1A9GGF2_9ACTN|nr:hemolysin family protein [Nocardioides dokdonensis]ANH37314.1 Hemolysin C [Nocardioides dokdonensis FR1436]